MQTYTVRKALRTPVHCQFYCFADGRLTSGIVWDLSEAGWRSTVDRPIPVGFETTVYITLCEGKKCHHLLIESAIVRWTDGCHAGWEITDTDELTHTRLTDFLEQDAGEHMASGVLKELHGDLRSHLAQERC